MPALVADSRAHVQRCEAMLREEIRAHGGWIPFSRFMDRALYEPGLGYYAAGARKFGAAGDFVTAPEISGLFGACLARSIAETLLQTGGNVLELGPGSGKLAADILTALDAAGALPGKYLLLEVSADLRERQQQRLAALPAHLFDRCEWLDSLPGTFVGAVVANEVLDVLPVSLVSYAPEGLCERGVSLRGDEFVWRDKPTLPSDVQALVDTVNRDVFANAPPTDYLTEFAPQVPALVAAVSECLQQGVMVWIDYGFRRAEYYHPTRNSGTLMCHYRHHAHTDPFLYPGLQDITAHVDFSAVAQAAVGAGAELIGYTTQANFLLAAGITDLLTGHDPRDAAHYLPLTNQLQRLVSPAEMGELFKVIGFSKGGLNIKALALAKQLPL
ncbi:MAG: class I SAM-dependent methyltransferase [Burkholderiales bacterium]